MKAILSLVFCAGLTGALAQTLSFRNTDLYTTTAERRLFLMDGTPLVGQNWVAQLLYGTSANSLTPHTQTASFRNVPTSDSFAGTWSGGTRTLTGMTPGSTVLLQVQVWDTTGGATFASALGKGISSTFTYQIPAAGGTPPPSAFFMEGFRSFTVNVPEPSGIGLVVLGAAAVLFLKHRRHTL